MDHDEETSLAKVLGANLRALMKAKDATLTSAKKIAAAGGPSNGTTGRIQEGMGCNIANLELLAKAFKVQPWQMLVPDLKPDALPKIAGAHLLQEIRDLVSESPKATKDKHSNSDDVERVERKKGRPTVMGPALRESLEVEGIRRATRKPKKVQKPKNRRRS